MGKIMKNGVAYSSGSNGGSNASDIAYDSSNVISAPTVEGTQDNAAAAVSEAQDRFSQLGTASTKSVANNLTTSTFGRSVLDAYQGKVLNGRLTTAESSITTLNDNYTNLKIEVTSICYTGNSVPTTETSYPCAWSGYDLLIICAVHYSNTRGTIVVPVTYFAETDSNSRPVVFDPSVNFGYDVYKNGDDAVYVRAGKTDSTRGVRIYGVKLAK